MDHADGENSKVVKTFDKDTIKAVNICGYGCIAYEANHDLCSLADAVEDKKFSTKEIESKIKQLTIEEAVSLLLSLWHEHPFLDWLSLLSSGVESRSRTPEEIEEQLVMLPHREKQGLLLSLSRKHPFLDWWHLLSFNIYSMI